MTGVVTTFLLCAAAVAAWSGVGWVVVDVPPTRALAPLALYVLLFTALTATSSLAAWIVLRPRRHAGHLRGAARYVGHAMLFSTIALFGLWLQSLRMLTGVVAVLLAVLYLFLELALLFGTRGSVDVDVQLRTLEHLEE